MDDFEDRPPLPSDWKPENVRAVRKLAQRDDADALVTLGGFYEEGLCHPDGTVLVRRNLREARRCLQARGRAAYNLAVTYKRLGRYREAFRWFQRAHDAGDPSALLRLGLAELYGVGTKRDPAGA